MLAYMKAGNKLTGCNGSGGPDLLKSCQLCLKDVILLKKSVTDKLCEIKAINLMVLSQFYLVLFSTLQNCSLHTTSNRNGYT